LSILLLAISQSQTADNTAAQAKLLERSPDWTELLKLAGRHHVTPQLYLGLQKQAMSRVPENIRVQLKTTYAANLKRNFRLAGHATKILNAFREGGVRVIPFKGVFLAQSVYGHLSSRAVNDIDLLICKDDHHHAREILQSMGYPAVEQLDQQEVFRNRELHIEIDLHWNIAPAFFSVDYDFEQLWFCSMPAELDGTAYRTLSDEDLLLLLTVQLAKDCWERQQKLVHLQKLADIARLIERIPESSLVLLQKRADTLGLSRIFNLGLLLSNEMLSNEALNGNVPASVAERARADRVRADGHTLKLARDVISLPELAETQLASEPNSLLDLRLRLHQMRFYMRLRERHLDKWQYLWRIVKVIFRGGVSSVDTNSTGGSENPQNNSHQLLALAALEDGAVALKAWQRWSETYDLDVLDADGCWILPLLFQNLSRLDFNDPNRQRLGGVYKQMRMGNAISKPGLLKLLTHLKRAQCDVMPAPLLALALQEAQEPVSTNPAGLLLPVEQLETADRVLQSLGWKPLMPLPPSALRPFVASIHYRHQRLRDVQVCWRPFGLDCPPNNDSLCWESSVQQAGEGFDTRAVSRVDRMLVTCLRGTMLQTAVVKDRVLADKPWLEVLLRAAELGLQQADLVPPAVRVNDESASIRQLWGRHRQRYQQCPAGIRPAGFLRYLVSYYAWVWQTTGAFQWMLSALRKTANK